MQSAEIAESLEIRDELTNSKTDPPSYRPTSYHGYRYTYGMSCQRAARDPPVVRASRHGNRRDLASVTPLSEEGHHERLDPRRAEQEREQVVHSGRYVRQRRAPAGRRGARARRGRRRLRRSGQSRVRARAAAAAPAGLEHVGRDGGSPPAHLSGELFFLFELHLDFFHFLPDSFARSDRVAFSEHFEAEDEE